MKFSDAMKNEARWTKTENGADAINTTGNACLDLFSTIGALRTADDSRICRLFAEAYKENPLFATKIVFYGRDVRGGLGEREVPRKLFKYMANYHPVAIKPNMGLIPFYGRFDDLYTFVDTPLENDMWELMKEQLEADIKSAESGKSVSLLAKWIKTPDASSKTTRKLGIQTAIKLGYNVRDFKRILRMLREKIKIVERYMSSGEWDKIDYSVVPSRAMHIYGDAFKRHDEERFNEYINRAVKGEVKINASTLYPYDLVRKISDWRYNYRKHGYEAVENEVVEAQWRALPNYVEDQNVIVIADTSDSMTWDFNAMAMCSAIGLAIYFAERNTGEFHNMWMAFNNESSIQYVKGDTLAQKLNNIKYNAVGGSTNLKAAFDKILNIAINNRIQPEDMPKSIIVISDMEINPYNSQIGNYTFHEAMKREYEENGYKIPNVVYWNVNSRQDVFHADSKMEGVQLVGGHSVISFKHILECIGYNPVEAMEKIINSERYASIVCG